MRYSTRPLATKQKLSFYRNCESGHNKMFIDTYPHGQNLDIILDYTSKLMSRTEKESNSVPK